MWFFSARKARPSTSVHPRRRSCRPGLALLEDRCCPSSTSYTVTDLGLAGKVGGLNDAIQVVGEAGPGNSAVAANHAFVYQDGTFTDLGTLGGPTSYAAAIKSAASPQMVGWADTANKDSSGNYIHHAVLWQQNTSGAWTITDLGTLGGNNSSATSINASGQVVGGSDISSGATDPFISQNGVMTDLFTLIAPNSGMTAVKGINDNGQIVGDFAARVVELVRLRAGGIRWGKRRRPWLNSPPSSDKSSTETAESAMR
jgi:probable HAF family extracellular repeat protein